MATKHAEVAHKPVREEYLSRHAYKEARNEWRRQCKRNPPCRKARR